MRSEPVRTQCVRQSEGHRLARRLRNIVVMGLFTAFVVGGALPTGVVAATLAQMQAQAARIASQVSAIENDYDHLQERYRGAQYRLDDLDASVRDLTADLDRTQVQLDVAERRLVQRAVNVYEAGSATTHLLNLAQAGSVTNFLDRVDTIQRVGEQDATILTDIKQLRRRVATKRRQLTEARVEQVKVVRQASRDKAAMGKKLAARQVVLNSVDGKVRKLVDAQRAAAAAAAAAAARESARSVPGGAGAIGAAAAVPDQGVASPATTGDTGAALSTPAAAAPPASGSAAAGASIAMGYIGTPYLWGGASPSGFDCSGLVMYSYAQVGLSIPHSTYAIWNMGTHVSRDQLVTGDLVFFSGLGHMGIYVGGGNFVHAPRSGTFVRVDSLYSSYGTNSYVGAVRL